jgi:ribosome-binding factor A
MSLRKKKIESLLKKLISGYLARFGIRNGFASITKIDLSKDLKSAKIFISVFPPSAKEKVLELLKKRQARIRKYIGLNSQMRYLPSLKFELDKGEENKRLINGFFS